MPKYEVNLQTHLNVVVTVDADDEDSAADKAWHKAQEFAETVWGNGRDVRAEADFDGVGADEIEEVES